MGYESRRARKLDQRTLAVFIENMDYETPGDFGYDIVLGFKQAAFSASWDVDIVPVTPAFQEKNRYDTLMMEKSCKGSYFLGFSLEDPWMKQLESTAIPTVLLDNQVSSPWVSYIGTDSIEAIDSAISYLITLGHEKIAFLNGSTGSMISDDRMAAYLQCLRKHHLQIEPNLAIYSLHRRRGALPRARASGAGRHRNPVRQRSSRPGCHRELQGAGHAGSGGRLHHRF